MNQTPSHYSIVDPRPVYSAPPTPQPTLTLHCSLSFSSSSRRQAFQCPVRPHTRMWEHTNTLWLCFLEMFLLFCIHYPCLYLFSCRRFLHKNSSMKQLVFICRPCSASTSRKIWEKYFVYCSTCHISALNIDETSFPQGYSERMKWEAAISWPQQKSIVIYILTVNVSAGKPVIYSCLPFV